MLHVLFGVGRGACKDQLLAAMVAKRSVAVAKGKRKGNGSDQSYFLVALGSRVRGLGQRAGDRAAPQQTCRGAKLATFGPSHKKERMSKASQRRRKQRAACASRGHAEPAYTARGGNRASAEVGGRIAEETRKIWTKNRLRRKFAEESRKKRGRVS